MNSDHKTRKTNSIHQPTKKTITEASWLLKGREFGAVYVTLIQTNKSESQVSRMQIRVVCLPCFKVYHTNRHFWGPNWKSRTMRCVNTVIIFSFTFYWWTNGSGGSVDFTNGFIKEQSLVWRNFTYMYLFSSATMIQKKI